MFMYQQELNRRYPTTAICLQVEEQKQQRLVTEEIEVGAVMAFTVYGCYLLAVPSFKNMRQFLLASDNDWPAEIRNFQRA